MFSDSLGQAERYAVLLATAGVERGLIGPREVPRLWERHLVNCALLTHAIPEGVDVCDIGTGAGLPGLVLALCRPDLSVTLVEPLLRRTRFLEEAVSTLGLERVTVVRARAEELHGTVDFAVVTSRAVAPLDRLVSWSLPLLREGGSMLAMKGAAAADEVAAAGPVLREHGAARVAVESYGDQLVDPPTTVVRVVSDRPSRLGLAAKKSGRGSSGASRSQRRKGRSR